MMGKQNAPEELFYKFRLEDHVPPDHPLRTLDAVLNFDRVRTVLADHYSHTGRPSVDPELMLRMLLVGYAYGIRSERQLCSEVHVNLAYRWFCRLGLEGTVPDRSTFSKNRYGRFRESDVYRVLFEEAGWRRALALRFVDRRESKEPIHSQYGRVTEVVEPEARPRPLVGRAHQAS